MLTTTLLDQAESLRDSITTAYRMDETTCVNQLLKTLNFTPEEKKNIDKIARNLVEVTREYKKRQSKIDSLLHQYDLSTDEGIALMCLAEALLRIPDKKTMDQFISDKLSTVEWQKHLSRDNSFFINAATWSLVLTGKIYGPATNREKNWLSSLKRATSRVGVSMIRPIILQMMKAIGKQFVMGETIEEALKRSQALQSQGYLFSYDMLGEAARTKEDAIKYYSAYVTAIHAIGATASFDDPAKNPGISIKLSALHPRYEYSQRERVLAELPPLLLSLAELAKKYRIGLTIDAEEADRLDLMLDIFEKTFTQPSLKDWSGLGLVVQAYQKRASYVIDWLMALSQAHQKKIMLRLVKGAYWDAEIKLTQIQGFNDYPVFTRKNATDVSYLACAKKLLAHQEYFYPQFGTHNAHSVAAILEMASNNETFEFQCLHGMGRPLYDQIVDQEGYDQSTRIYAPVGTHKDLLGYLVRRLLENGANSSFINRLADESIPVEKIVADPIDRIASLQHKPHPKIPKPADIYVNWKNSRGVDFSNQHELNDTKSSMDQIANKVYQVASLINGQTKFDKSNAIQSVSPANFNDVVGNVTSANDNDIETALQCATAAKNHWTALSVVERVAILERAAELFQEHLTMLATVLIREAGKCVPDCIAEIRETIDYCRYYAYRAREDLKTIRLPGPTGEENQMQLHGRGLMVCISPWNFPLAIFIGQVVAALVTGNTVIAKPAEQTPIIAYLAIQILLKAGIPKDVLQLLIGTGPNVGAKLVADERVAGVMFTGSTETAKNIEQSLANRKGPIGVLIAETGGQNALIVDSSALPEQVVLDIVQSSFNSAGQRCSALRILFVQEEIADRLLTMLAGYMTELSMGDPRFLSTDIGPVIDKDALSMLENHYHHMQTHGKIIARVSPSPDSHGYYFAPCVAEIPDLEHLKREIFGPILHVVRYSANDLDKVMDTIVETGYGLTLGVHSRIDQTIQYITSRMPVGNIYVNRNMIGAVVGVQPFGGERLSGTGPKAGGPHYLPRLCVERTISVNTTAVGGNAKLVSLLEED